jgi:aminoglycoside 3-N-acetyltransferase
MTTQPKPAYAPPSGAARVDKPAIAEGLARAGMRSGDTVLVHSSLSRFGYVDGGADAVIDALLEAVAQDGTLIMSAITADTDTVVRCIEAADAGQPLDIAPFDVLTADTWAGTIPQTFRRRPGVVRSLHPTHSVTAFGPRAKELLAGQQNVPGPCGQGTPFMRLTELDRGFVLLLGVNHESNTTLHGFEELAQLDYVLYPKPCTVPVLAPGGPILARTRVHMPFLSRHLGALETEYIDRRAQTVTQIGDSYVRLIHAATMRDVTLAALEENPFVLLSKRGHQAWAKMNELGVYTRNPLAARHG